MIPLQTMDSLVILGNDGVSISLSLHRVCSIVRPGGFDFRELFGLGQERLSYRW